MDVTQDAVEDNYCYLPARFLMSSASFCYLLSSVLTDIFNFLYNVSDIFQNI